MTDSALNILLVDDDEVDVIIVRRAFATSKISNPLFVARDGVEALEMLRGGTVPHPHVVLMDLNMPRMNGIECLREIRNDPALKATTVIVMTTSMEERDRIEAFKLNVSGYIVKPVTFRAFADAMAMMQKYWTLMEL